MSTLRADMPVTNRDVAVVLLLAMTDLGDLRVDDLGGINSAVKTSRADEQLLPCLLLKQGGDIKPLLTGVATERSTVFVLVMLQIIFCLHSAVKTAVGASELDKLGTRGQDVFLQF